MKTPMFSRINESSALAVIDIADLVATGLKIEEDFAIVEGFHYAQEIKNSELTYLHICRSHGWEGNLEFNFGLCLESSDNNENIHITQEVAVYRDMANGGSLYFCCPFTGEEEPLTKLYLRADFPMFASKKALNIR